MNFLENFAHVVAKFPVRIMRLKLTHVADPPDVVADAVGFLVPPVYFFAADFLAHLDGFEHGTIALPAAADVMDFAAALRPNEYRERFDEAEPVDVVGQMFAFAHKHSVTL